MSNLKWNILHCKFLKLQKKKKNSDFLCNIPEWRSLETTDIKHFVLTAMPKGKRKIADYRIQVHIIPRQLCCCSVPKLCLTLWPHGLQNTRLPCPPLSPRVCSNSCSLTQWCHPNHLMLCHPLLLLPSIFPSIRVFSNELALCFRWPKYCSFSISPSSEYSGLISFRVVWIDLQLWLLCNIF